MSSSVPSLRGFDGANRVKPDAGTPASELSRSPFPVPAEVERIRAAMDWASFLPARATSLEWRLQAVLKRGIDIIGAAIGLAVLSPIMMLLVVAVKLTSRGPIFYQWNVLGERAQPFVGYKFRTMVEDAERLKEQYESANEMSGPVFKMRSDPRVTRIGGWLRKYSLDELPQLWSVLKGDMSLVGPRPVFPAEFIRFEDWHRGKLAVRPGLTCLWQISGRNEINRFDDWAALDRKYIEEWSLALDFRILMLTFPAVLGGRGAY